MHENASAWMLHHLHHVLIQVTNYEIWAFTKPGLWTGLDCGLDYGLTTLLNYLGSFLSDFSCLANQTLL